MTHEANLALADHTANQSSFWAVWVAVQQQFALCTEVCTCERSVAGIRLEKLAWTRGSDNVPFDLFSTASVTPSGAHIKPRPKRSQPAAPKKPTKRLPAGTRRARWEVQCLHGGFLNHGHSWRRFVLRLFGQPLLKVNDDVLSIYAYMNVHT